MIPPPVIDVSGLCVARSGVSILSDLSWRVEAGEHWVLMGANGSGKTSLLNVLTAYLSPTRGTVRVLGEEYGRSDWRELRKRVGVVTTAIPSLMPADEPGLGVILSGRAAMIGHWGSAPDDDVARARRLLSEVDGEHLAERPWRVLSQGERQRLLIGRALMAEPALLILDEPCAGLDPAAREHFLEFVQRLALSERAPTLVFVTHHVEEIVPAFSHVLLLAQGRALAAGPVAKTLTSHALGEAFGTDVTVRRSGERFSLEISSIGAEPGRIV